jgi:hypothetical protein
MGELMAYLFCGLPPILVIVLFAVGFLGNASKNKDKK